MKQVTEVVGQVQAFEKEAHVILASHESSRSRVVTIEGTYKQLANLSLRQDELFRQGLRCVEHTLFRAAHVMAWAGFMDFLEEKLGSDGFNKLNNARPKWNIAALDQLRETHAEYQIIDAAREAGLCTKSMAKCLHGLLSKRNECAHPSDYSPGLNETLGYVSELISRAKLVAKVPY